MSYRKVDLPSYKIIPVFLLLMLNISILAKTNLNSETDQRLWISLGLGGSDDNIGSWQPNPALAFSANFTSNDRIYRFRYYFNTLSMPYKDNISETRDVSDIGILYGYYKRFKFGACSISGGISYVTGRYEKQMSMSWYKMEEFSTLGFPFEAELYWLPDRIFGLGVSLFGVLNNEKNFYGIMFSANLGKVRSN